MATFGFEKLEVWQLAITYANEIYQTTESFPKTELYGLSSQLRRASVSISSNIAEGSGRSTAADKSRFYEIAYGSLLETVSQLHIAHQLSFISKASFEELTERAERFARMLSGLRSHTRKQ